MKNSSYQGLQKDIKNIKTPEIEVVKNEYDDRDYEVHLEFPEFTCMCPKTGLPDFANITIDYVPDKTIVELKSLKLYFVSYRNIGIFHENVVNKILDDLINAAKPRSIQVVGEFGIRGGIKTSVAASYPAQESNCHCS